MMPCPVNPRLMNSESRRFESADQSRRSVVCDSGSTSVDGRPEDFPSTEKTQGMRSVRSSPGLSYDIGFFVCFTESVTRYWRTGTVRSRQRAKCLPSGAQLAGPTQPSLPSMPSWVSRVSVLAFLRSIRTTLPPRSSTLCSPVGDSARTFDDDRRLDSPGPLLDFSGVAASVFLPGCDGVSL